MVAVFVAFSGQRAFAFFCPCKIPLGVATAVLHPQTNMHITQGFNDLQNWMISVYFQQNLLVSHQLSTSQQDATAMKQLEAEALMSDADGVVDNARRLQSIDVALHNEFNPSEELCAVGTNTRALFAADVTAQMNHEILANRAAQRFLRYGDSVSLDGETSDRRSRIGQFLTTFCSQDEAGGAFKGRCTGTRPGADIDIVGTLLKPSTLSIDYTDNEVSADEANIMALQTNLFGSQLTEKIPTSLLVDSRGNVSSDAKELILDERALAANYMVAMAPFTKLAGLKSMGPPEGYEFLKAVMEDSGIPESEIESTLKGRPSYYATMEILGQTMYESSDFYVSLGDEPANINRRIVGMQAINIMQMADLLDFLRYSKMNYSLILADSLRDRQDALRVEVESLDQEGSTKPRSMPF